MMGVSSGCGLCPWSCSGKVGAYGTVERNSLCWALKTEAPGSAVT